MGNGRARLPHWLGSPAALGCVSIRLKFGFAVLLAARQFANYVCIALAGSVGFPVPFVHKENSSRRFNAHPRATPKEGNHQNALARFDKISPGARKSGAAVRPTRGGELGRALGRAVLWAEHGAEIWAVDWAELLAELLRLFEPRSPPPPHAADCNSSGLVALSAGGDCCCWSRGGWGVTLATLWVARAEVFDRGGPQLAMLVLGLAGFGRQSHTK